MSFIAFVLSVMCDVIGERVSGLLCLFVKMTSDKGEFEGCGGCSVFGEQVGRRAGGW